MHLPQTVQVWLEWVSNESLCYNIKQYEMQTHLFQPTTDTCFFFAGCVEQCIITSGQQSSILPAPSTKKSESS
jgi:hypothetical protein